MNFCSNIVTLFTYPCRFSMVAALRGRLESKSARPGLSRPAWQKRLAVLKRTGLILVSVRGYRACEGSLSYSHVECGCF